MAIEESTAPVTVTVAEIRARSNKLKGAKEVQIYRHLDIEVPRSSLLIHYTLPR